MLIFDLDGTLFRTETVTVPATREAFEQLGLEPPGAAEIRAFIGRTGAEFDAWLAGRCEPAVAGSIIQAAAERELDLIGRTGALYPGVREALETLRAAARVMAICSNGSQRYVERVLREHDLERFFDAVRVRQPDDRDKPQMAGELLGRLGAAGPGALIAGAVIGDRRDDIEAARANGLRAIGCAYGYGQPGELDAADAVAHCAAELVELAAP